MEKYNLYFFIAFFFIFSNATKPNNIAFDSIENKLDEVMITATKTKRVLSSLPLNASIITSDQIQNTNANRLSEIINEELGLITVDDFGGVKGIQMQGLDSQYTLILIDNQPIVGRSAGTLDLDRISVGNIQQIEIVRGASSSLYGNEALAGVINIITKDPSYGFAGSISSSVKTHTTIDNNINLNFGNDKFKSSLFYNHFSSDGYDLDANDVLRTVNKFENSTTQLKLSYPINDKFEVKFNFRNFTQTIDNIASSSLSGESSTDEENINLSLVHQKENINTRLDIYFSNYFADEYLNDENGNLHSESFFDQIIFKPELKSEFRTKKNNTIVVGLGNKKESLNRTYFDIKPTQNSIFTYFQYDFNPSEKINLIIGSRFDNTQEYNSQLSPKFSGIYKFNKDLSLKFSSGYGFKAPEFRQLYFNFTNSTQGYSVIGYNVVQDVINQLINEGQISNIIVSLDNFNDKLKAESSFSLNFGIDYQLNSKTNINLNVFNNSTQNLIDVQVIANKTNGQNIFSYYNINRVSTYGLELNSDYEINKDLSILLGYQLLYAYDLDAQKAFENGEVFARLTPQSNAFRLKKSDYYGLYNRSRHMGSFKINHKNPKKRLSSSLRIIYRSKYGLFDTNSNNYLDKYDQFVDGYFTANTTLIKKFDKIDITAGIENILNYKDVQNISSLSGRIYYFKLKYNLNQL